MAKTKAEPMKNAEKIIERFGGIRPMAAKIDAPVTTVQGWKKRNVIPANRREQVLAAAQDNNIDLTDIDQNGSPLDTTVVSTKSVEKKASVKKQTPKKAVEQPKVEKPKPQAAVTPSVEKVKQDNATPTHDAILTQIENNNRKNLKTSAWIAVFIVLLGLAVAAFLLWPLMRDEAKGISGDNPNVTRKIEQLETKVDNVDERTSVLNRMIPENIGLKVEQLQDQARDLRESVTDLSNKANEISAGVLSPDAGRLSDRLAYLEEKVESLSNNGNFSSLISRVQSLENSVMGQRQLERSVEELEDMVGNMQNDQSLDSNLAVAQDQKEGALGETLQGVSNDDLKAAAMLLAFSKFRDTLNREQPFEDDLILLQRLAGEDNPELQGALLRLAPQADDGVLTSEGLSGELKTLTGDIVFASLKGEDVSIKEKAVARLNNVFQVEKEGKPILGTETQMTVAEAQKLLDKGDVQGAIAALETLDGEAAETAHPFLEKAQATILAGDVQDMISQTILSKVSGIKGVPGLSDLKNMGTGNNSFNSGGAFDMNEVRRSLENALPDDGTGNQVIRDEESGLTILPRSQKFKGFSGGQ